MAATRDQITAWFDRGLAEGSTHMIVKCDTFDGPDDCCYPVYVQTGQDAREIADTGQDKVREVYLLDPARRVEQLTTNEVVMNFESGPRVPPVPEDLAVLGGARRR